MKFAKMLSLTVLLLAVVAVSASAQVSAISYGALSGTCTNEGTFGKDLTNGYLYYCGGNTWRQLPGAAQTKTLTATAFDTAGSGNVFKSKGTTVGAVAGTIGIFQGVTATGITDGNFNVLTGPAISVAAGGINAAGKHLRIYGKGIYTNAAASLLNVDIALCTVSGCGSGTVLSPAGCVVTSTNQANNLTNGQFAFTCDLTTATTGATGTLMAKALGKFNLGAATSAVLSEFGDTATAVSAAVDLTVAEFIHPRFKFTTANAGNSATLQQLIIEVLN